MRLTFTLLICILSLSSCVSQDKYDVAIHERDAAVLERDALKSELHDIQFSAPSLLKDGNRFYAAKDYAQARKAFTKLSHDFSERPEGAEAKNLLLSLDEDESWNASLTSNDVSTTEAYLQKYPDGRYHGLASTRLEKLKSDAEASEYELALQRNSSLVWKRFLEQYPNRKDENSIRRKIIQLEVDEILAGEHGDLPSSVATSFGTSGRVTVAIRNDTGYPLTIRYSGSDVASIDIPVAESRAVRLSSGSYKIAASANGLSYGGTEYLDGNYSSRFYITRSTSSYSNNSSPYNSY